MSSSRITEKHTPLLVIWSLFLAYVARVQAQRGELPEQPQINLLADGGGSIYDAGAAEAESVADWAALDEGIKQLAALGLTPVQIDPEQARSLIALYEAFLARATFVTQAGGDDPLLSIDANGYGLADLIAQTQPTWRAFQSFAEWPKAASDLRLTAEEAVQLLRAKGWTDGWIIGEVRMYLADEHDGTEAEALAELLTRPGAPPKLSDCPFFACPGAEAEIDRLLRKDYEDNPGDPDAYHYFITCPGCGASGGHARNRASAARNWNTRAGC